MAQSSTVSGRVREHFQRTASSFDRLYEDDHALQRLVRPGLLRRRELAVETVRRYPRARVLDVGCGSGRVGEAVLDAGAESYVGIDFSAPMVELAGKRLARFGAAAELIEADFLEDDLAGPFDVVLALGFFDYAAEPARLVERMARVCTGTIVASFPRWTWLRGPVRKMRYEVVNKCPVYHYTEDEIREMFGAVGFDCLDLLRGPSGFLLIASRSQGAS